MAYLEPCLTFAYSELCHIQNPGIFRTQSVSKTNININNNNINFLFPLINKYIYCDVTPYHHNGFVATCWLGEFASW